jgi:hypothetical protein
MHPLIVLGVLGAFGALWLVGRRYAPGEGPFDRLPAGVSPKPAGSRVQASADGTRYLVHYWPPSSDGRQFHVAEVKGARAWLSFWADPAGKRSLVLSLAHAGELNDMRKDWGV